MTKTMTQTSELMSSWGEWIAEHGSKLFVYARQQTRTYEDAEDVLQDAIAKLASKIKSSDFIGGESAWLPYLYSTIRRLSIDLSRKYATRSKHKDAAAEASFATGEDDWFESESDKRQLSRQLEETIKKLPNKFAEVIVMKIWGERTFAEIAQILETSQNTVASRYRYGLDMLKRQLATLRKAGEFPL